MPEVSTKYDTWSLGLERETLLAASPGGGKLGGQHPPLSPRSRGRATGEGLKVSAAAGGTAGDALGVGCSFLGLAPRGSLKSSS